MLNESDRRAYFEVEAHDLDIMPQLIEKDFWVCWILKILFSLPSVGSHLTFKGGTSLSKCYNVIKRFSEDVDVSIERTFLVSQESIEPEEKQSGKENLRRLNRLKQLCQETINKVIVPELKDKVGVVLSGTGVWSIEIDPYDTDGQTILFTFPNIIESSMDDYTKPVVRIELGARSDHWPVEVMPVKPYVSNVLNMDGASVRVLGAERTFWEKATILHAISNNLKLRARMSRHYYDVFEMADSPIFNKAIQNIDLLVKVAEHKALFFRDTKARYDLARPGSLRLIPQSAHITELKADYQRMREMFFEEPPKFDEVVQTLKKLEEEVNAAKE